MTLDKHRIEGLTAIRARVLSTAQFELLMIQAGYNICGSASAKGDRVKIWWVHPKYKRVESIYSPDKQTAITAYHLNEL